MKKILILFFAFALSTFELKAQNDLTLYNMENVFQSTYVNPSAIPVHTVSIGLPVISSVSGQFTNTGFSYGDLFQRGHYTNDTVRGNIGNAYRKLDSENFLYLATETDLFHVRVKVRQMYFSLFSQVKMKFRYSYPQNLMNLVLNGNGGAINQEISFKNFGADFDLYRNIGFGIAKEWKHWSLGANLKYINGIVNINLDPGKNSGIEFDDQYFGFKSLSDLNLRSSGFNEDFTPVNNYENKEGQSRKAPSSTIWDMSKNPGAAIDLGATYKPSDKWSYSLSVINMGFINWTSDVVNRKITGGRDFRGFDAFGYYIRGQNKEDSANVNELKESFKYSTSTEKYKRYMTPQVYATVKYNITYKTHLGLTTYFEYYKKLRPAFTFSVYHKFGRVFNIVGTYNIQYRTYDNIGLGLMAKVGPCQFYLAGDNLVSPLVRSALDGFKITHKTIDPLKTFNLRLGMNLVFGKVHLPSKQTYEYKKN